jgi:ubiquinone/menaquinone biosynthesis C-methylase UbiE
MKIIDNLRLVKDKNGLIRLQGLFSKKKLLKYYKEEYFNKSPVNYKKTYTDLEIKSKLINFRIYYFFIKKFFQKKINCLEIGCGEGYGARYLSNKTNYTGVELDNFSIKKHNYNYYKRIKFYKGDFLSIKNIKNNYYNAIIFNGVFEHLPNLKKTMKFIDRTIKKGGLVFINVPNDFNILQNHYLRTNRIKKKDAPWVSFEHINYFNKHSLSNIFKEKYSKISIMADYPIDQFLLNDNTNYYKKKEFGKIANSIRMKFHTLFLDSKLIPIKNYINFCEAAAEINLGRTLTACFRKI